MYRARDARGKVVKGKLHAANEAAAVNELRVLGLTPLSVRDNASLGLLSRDLDTGIGGGKPKLRDLAVASKQLAVMIRSGVSLLRALEIMGQQTEHAGLARAFGEVRREVGQGTALSVSLERQNDIFPPLMINLVQVGEAGGFLDEALDSIADNFETEMKLQQKIKGAMAYPIVVLGVAVLAVVAMLLFVVPTFENMFANLGSELPVPTLILIGLSRSAVIWVPAVAVIVLLIALWYTRHRKDDAVRRVVDTAKVKMPVFGQLFRKVAIARFSRNLAIMLRAGVPMLQAISLVSKVSGNWVIEQALADAENSVRQGRPFAQPLAQHEVFPPMVTQMVAVGEDSGSLDQMLTTISEFYDLEVETASDQLTSLIEPLLIVLVGGVIGSMVISLYLPVFSMITAVQESGM
ncbi:MAG: type II secretion system F family protein [Leucobacter sp.]|nr:type II secretion system F family protein [Leucobacter sp.]